MINTDTNRDGAALPMPAVIGAVAALLALVGFLAWRTLRPAGPPAVAGTAATKAAASANPQGAQDTAWMKGVVQQTGGDVNKLSPEDRQRLDRITRGNSAAVLKSMAGK